MSRLIQHSGGRRSGSGLIILPGNDDDIPNFADGSFTLIDSDDMQAYTDIMYIGDIARFYEPQQAFIPYPSRMLVPADVDPTVTQTSVVNGRNALRLRYPAGNAVSPRWQRKHDIPVPITNEDYVQIKVRYSTEESGPITPFVFAIKGMLHTLPKNQRRQFGMHDGAPWHPEYYSPAPPDRITYYELYHGGFTDEYEAFPVGHDQGKQFQGPYFLSMLNDGQDHVLTFGSKDMSPAEGTVTIVGGVATFSVSQAGKITNGARLRIDDHNELLPGHARVVSGFNGTNQCTLISGADSSDVTDSLFAINGGGAFGRMWIDGQIVLDVRQSAVGQFTPGTDKQRCGQSIVDSFLVGGPGRETGELSFGSSQSVPGLYTVLIDYLDFKRWTRAAA